MMGVESGIRTSARGGASIEDLERGEGLCDAYEAYRGLFRDPRFTLEHAILLLRAISQAREIGIGHCVDCDALVVFDVLGTARRSCAYCASDDDYAEVARDHCPLPLLKVAEESAGYQHSLF